MSLPGGPLPQCGTACYAVRYTEAELVHERATAIREKALGPDHPIGAAGVVVEHMPLRVSTTLHIPGCVLPIPGEYGGDKTVVPYKKWTQGIFKKSLG